MNVVCVATSKLLYVRMQEKESVFVKKVATAVKVMFRLVVNEFIEVKE